MSDTTCNQWTILNEVQNAHLESWLDAFLLDRKAQNMTNGTLFFYKNKLDMFIQFCDTQEVKYITQITPDLIRMYIFYLDSKGHNAGGIHAYYRTLKTFLRWWENEVEPEGWKNPIKKVKAPKNPIEPLDPVNIDDVKAMLNVCPKDTLIGLRDKAMMLFLLDTGIRASELLAMNINDIIIMNGEILIRQGKGRKSRNVFIGSKTRKAIRAYLKRRKDNNSALWISMEQERLSYWGLKSVIRNRANQAGVNIPSLHSFRRWFALTCLRAGANVYSIQELMGHTDLQVLKRYLKQTNLDLIKAYKQVSPVDNC
jgi:site-specific recombinase XerD